MRLETHHGNKWKENLSFLPRTGSSAGLWKFTTCMLAVFISLFCTGGSAFAEAISPGNEPDPVTEAEFQVRVTELRNRAVGASMAPNDRDQLAAVIGRLMQSPPDPAALQALSAWFDTWPGGNMFNYYSTAFAVNKWWPNLSDAQRNNIRDNMVTIGNQPGIRENLSWLGLGTPNHQIMRLVGGALYGQLWPDDAVFRGNQTGSELVADVKPRLMAISRNLYSRGEYEHMSPTYLAVHIGPWLALYDQTNDPELKAAADAALRYFATTLASSHLYGQHVGPYRRENVTQRALYETRGADPALASTQRICWLWWGDNSRSLVGHWDARRVGRDTYIAAASSWRPPAAINRIALGTEPLSSRGSVPQSNHAGGLLVPGSAYPNSEGQAYRLPHPHDNHKGLHNFTWYREQQFAMGSQWLNWDPDEVYGQATGTGIIYNVTRAKGAQMIDITHPYWEMNRQNWQGAFEGRQSPFENTSHHLNTFISLFNIPTDDPWAERGRLDFRERKRSPLIQEGRLRYPATRDEVVEEGEWVFIREAEVYFAIRPLNGYTLSTDTPTGTSNPYRNNSHFHVLSTPGPRTGFIVDVVIAAEFASFAAFRAAVLARPLTIDLAGPSVTYQSVRGHTMTASWTPVDYTYNFLANPDGSNTWLVQPTADDLIRVRNTFFVNGATVEPDETYPVLVNDYVDIRDYQATVSTPSGGFTVDWRGEVPVIRNR